MISLIALFAAYQADITQPDTKVPNLLKVLRESRLTPKVLEKFSGRVLLPPEIVKVHDGLDLPLSSSTWSSPNAWIYIPSRPVDIAGMKDVVLIESSEPHWTVYYMRTKSRGAFSGTEKFPMNGRWQFKEVSRLDGWNIVSGSGKSRQLDEKTTLNLRYLIILAAASKDDPNYEVLLGVLTNKDHRVEIYSNGVFKADGKWYSPSALEWAQVCRQLRLFK